MIESFHWINTGYTTGYERIAKGKGSWKKVKFPANVGVLKDDQLGYMLFDTGYGSSFNKATSKWPFILYRWITPVYYKEENGIVAQLQKLGIEKDEIKFIILSHMHADHKGALKEFPEAKIICSRGSIDVLNNSNFKLLRNGILPHFLPDDLDKRTIILEDLNASTFYPFTKSWELFDGLIKVIDLPGHAKGQFGLIFQYAGQQLFLVADAAWYTSAISNQQLPASIVSCIVDDWQEYRLTINKLHNFNKENPHIIMIPTHCTENNYPFQIE